MKKFLLMLTATAIIFGLYWYSPYNQSEREAVELIHPQVSDIRDMLVLQGSIMDAKPIKLYAEGNAVVREIFVEPGQKVCAGQPILCLERTEGLYTSEDAVAAAVIQIQQAIENGDISAAQELAKDLVPAESPSDTWSSDRKVYELYSPLDCMVLDVKCAVGETVTGLLPCVVLCDEQNLQIEAEATEDIVGFLQKDLLCEITIPAFQDRKLEGKIETIMPYARQTGFLTGTPSAKTSLRISMTDPTGLKPGYRAEVKVITAQKSASLLVPYEAVQQDEAGQEYVFLLEQNRAVRRNVKTGSELDDSLEIVEGITRKDLLLLSPNTTLEGAFIQYELAGSDSSGT